MKIVLKGMYVFYRDLELEVVGMLKQTTRFVLKKILYMFCSMGNIRNPAHLFLRLDLRGLTYFMDMSIFVKSQILTVFKVFTKW